MLTLEPLCNSIWSWDILPALWGQTGRMTLFSSHQQKSLLHHKLLTRLSLHRNLSPPVETLHRLGMRVSVGCAVWWSSSGTGQSSYDGIYLFQEAPT